MTEGHPLPPPARARRRVWGSQKRLQGSERESRDLVTEGHPLPPPARARRRVWGSQKRLQGSERESRDLVTEGHPLPPPARARRRVWGSQKRLQGSERESRDLVTEGHPLPLRPEPAAGFGDLRSAYKVPREKVEGDCPPPALWVHYRRGVIPAPTFSGGNGPPVKKMFCAAQAKYIVFYQPAAGEHFPFFRPKRSSG